MKKFISMILVSVMILSYGTITNADYTESSYDVPLENITYDDGTVTNDIDGSSALQVTESTNMFTYEKGTTVFTNEFFLSFDFRFDTISDGTVSGKFGINRIDPNGKNAKTGPMFSYNNGTLRTQTGSSSFQNLGTVNADEWYTAELEGKMVTSGANVVFRLYNYVDGEKTLVNTVNSLNLRQFYAGATNGNPNFMYASNMSIDNVVLIQEYPDEIVISSTADTMDAGTTVSLDYEQYRQDVLFTKHPVEWSVYNEDDTALLNDENIQITSDGILSADISASSKTVTVRATSTYEGKELYASKQIQINAVDTGDEKFDTVTVSGADTVKSGTDTEYTVTATKNGEDVTSTLVDGDLVWEIYNCEDLVPNNNKSIKVDNGKLTVKDGVLPQDIHIRAYSASKKVYGSKAVKIEFGDSQIETVYASTACETTVDGVDNAVSIDGSNAYYMQNANKIINFGDHSDYVYAELDVKLMGSGSGFTLLRKDGTNNSCFRYYDGNIAMQTGSSAFTRLMATDAEAWYHFEIVYSSANENASFNVYKYNEDGTLGERNRFTDVSRRNGKAFGAIQIEGNTYVDNIKVTKPIADDIVIRNSVNNIFAGESTQFSAETSKLGLPLLNESDLEWSVLDSTNLPIIDGTVTISDAGLLETDPLVTAQTVTVKVKNSIGASDSVTLNIQSSEVFTVSNIGVNEDGTKIVKLYVEKNYFYEDEVAFIIAIHGQDGVLKDIKIIRSFGTNFSIGANEMAVDYTLPSDFDSSKDAVSVYAWSAF